ncbi:ABC transporter ATP-binding protein [Chloroflexi bacterium TSY]|nr:ABC transporter ATP-binding protein [Chloroflexi bacterium TSY]
MTPTNPFHAIKLQNLNKTYQKRGSDPIQAVRDLNLTVPHGQVLGFLGENGAGKTTTIKMMCGLVHPTTGQVELNGHDVAKQRSQAIQQMGAVLEGTRNVYWRLTALQNLIYFGRLKGFWGRRMKRRAEQLLTELELWERRNDPVRDFSRGMQQKVAIACALIANPPIVLLDEPTLGLDVHAARTVKQWIHKLAREEGKTVVLTTHQLDMAEELCDRVAIIRKGVLIADEPTNKLLDLFRQESYEICIDGQIDHTALDRMPQFSDTLTLTHENGHTKLTCHVQDQNQLYSVLDAMRTQTWPLISVVRSEPNLEEVFVKMTRTEQDNQS